MPPKDPRIRARWRKAYRARNLERIRAYHRAYQKKWYRNNLAQQRKYHREWKSQWRASHPRKARAYLRGWRRNNPEKVRAMHHRWYAKHGAEWRQRHRTKRLKQQRKYYRKERRIKLQQQQARRRRYYWRNRERINQKRKQIRAAKPGFFRSWERERYRRHRIKRIVSQRNIQARRRGATGTITPEQWLRLLRRHNFGCFYCGTRLIPRNRTLDHKIPLSRGGTNTISNVVPACRLCNQRKMRMTAREFLARQRK